MPFTIHTRTALHFAIHYSHSRESWPSLEPFYSLAFNVTVRSQFLIPLFVPTADLSLPLPLYSFYPIFTPNTHFPTSKLSAPFAIFISPSSPFRPTMHTHKYIDTKRHSRKGVSERASACNVHCRV